MYRARMQEKALRDFNLFLHVPRSVKLQMTCIFTAKMDAEIAQSVLSTGLWLLDEGLVPRGPWTPKAGVLGNLTIRNLVSRLPSLIQFHLESSSLFVRMRFHELCGSDPVMSSVKAPIASPAVL